jgi:hypothetical protein
MPIQVVITDDETDTTVVIDDPSEISVVTVEYAQGPAGPPGSAGGASVTHNQTTPSATWTINHAISTLAPTVVILLTGETRPVETDIDYFSGQVVLTFPSPATGTAYIS